MNAFKSIFISDNHQIKNHDDVAIYYSVGFTNLFAVLVYSGMAIYGLIIQNHALAIADFIGAGLEMIFLLLGRRGMLKLALVVPSFVLIINACVVTCFTGWLIGYQWYIVAAIIPHFLFVRTKTGWQAALTITGIAALFVCFFVTVYYDSPYDLSDNVGLRLANLILLMVTLLTEVKMNDIALLSSLRHLEEESMVDPLTGLWNRRYALQVFAKLNQPNFCIAMLDIDHFKNVNDQYGHDAGDKVLPMLAHQLKADLRISDVVIRWGGEEFLIILQNTTLRHAKAVMEEIRSRVELTTCRVDAQAIKVTITIGIAEYDGNADLEEMIKRSDCCLYYGKRNGRNQVVCYEDGFGMINN